MKNTIKAKTGYTVKKLKEGSHPTFNRVVMDGDEVLFGAVLETMEEYKYNQEQNECFNLCEVFTTEKGNQFIYWRDEETDIDYLTKVTKLN